MTDIHLCRGKHISDLITWSHDTLWMEWVWGEAGIRQRGWTTTAHTMLVLPLEQFIFHTFEKAPWTTEVEREETADRGRREVEREKQSKAYREVKRRKRAKRRFKLQTGGWVMQVNVRDTAGSKSRAHTQCQQWILHHRAHWLTPRVKPFTNDSVRGIIKQSSASQKTQRKRDKDGQRDITWLLSLLLQMDSRVKQSRYLYSHPVEQIRQMKKPAS